MGHERITVEDNVITAITKLSEGNPGALTVLMSAYKYSIEIDPDALLGGFAPMLSIDTLGIYGHRIWMLFKDVCKEDLPSTLAVLRAWQLGILPDGELNHAIDNYGDGIKIDELRAAVKERLPMFDLEWILPQNA